MQKSLFKTPVSSFSHSTSPLQISLSSSQRFVDATSSSEAFSEKQSLQDILLLRRDEFLLRVCCFLYGSTFPSSFCNFPLFRDTSIFDLSLCSHFLFCRAEVRTLRVLFIFVNCGLALDFFSGGAATSRKEHYEPALGPSPRHNCALHVTFRDGEWLWVFHYVFGRRHEIYSCILWYRVLKM